VIWSRLQDRIVRILNSLHVGAKTPLNTDLVRTFVHKSNQPSNPRRPRAQEFITARANSSPRGVRGDQGEAARGLGRAGAPLEDALTVVELEEDGHPVARTAPITAVAQKPPRWVLTSRRPLRSRSHREWRTRVPVMAYSGELPPQVGHATVVTPPLPTESSWVVHPCINGWD
jgi:hypothetical protein